jgi:hypothetical protein
MPKPKTYGKQTLSSPRFGQDVIMRHRTAGKQMSDSTDQSDGRFKGDGSEGAATTLVARANTTMSIT